MANAKDLQDDDLDEDEELTGVSLIERLSSVEGWEMYRVVGEDTALVSASIGLRAAADGAGVEYALWLPTDEDEPVATGTLKRNVAWSDVTRVASVRHVLAAHADVAKIDAEKLEFTFVDDDEDEGEG